jgi:hypothetical protein
MGLLDDPAVWTWSKAPNLLHGRQIPRRLVCSDGDYVAKNDGFQTVDCLLKISRQENYLRPFSLVAIAQEVPWKAIESRSCMRDFTRATVSMATGGEMFEKEEFIHLILIRPILWDISSEEYSNKTKKHRMLGRMCAKRCTKCSMLLKWQKKMSFSIVTNQC